MLLVGFRMALVMNIDQLIIWGDLKIVYGHITSIFEAKEDNMKKYFTLAKALALRFQNTWFEKIDRRNNKRAYELSKAISGEEILRIWL